MIRDFYVDLDDGPDPIDTLDPAENLRLSTEMLRAASARHIRIDLDPETSAQEKEDARSDFLIARNLAVEAQDLVDRS